MSWSALQNLWGADQSTSGTANNWGNDSPTISLNPGESCVIQLKGTPNATASDLQFRVLASNDGGTTFDTIPYVSGSLGHPGSTTPQLRTITVFGVPSFKLQLAPSAAYAWTVCNATYKKDGISA